MMNNISKVGKGMEYKILVAEDDADIQNILKMYLESAGYIVSLAYDGLKAYDIVRNERIDMAIIDVMMPGMNGFELTKLIREKYNFPILILSAKIEGNDKILGLNLGADDYITKPFNPVEVIARVNANLRRYYKLNSDSVHDQTVLVDGELSLDTKNLIVTRGEEEIILTPNEYKILALLMKQPGRVFSKSQICEAINGEYYDNYESVIAVHITHLRDKIENDSKNPKYIKTVRGLGYKIEKINNS